MKNITTYIKEVIEEAKHVTWPSRNQTIFSTVAVLVVSLFVAYYLGVFDYAFSHGLEWVLNR